MGELHSASMQQVQCLLPASGLFPDFLSDQVVLHRIVSGGSRGDLNFTIDRGQVDVDTTGADNELLCHLGIGEPLSYQAQHLRLSAVSLSGMFEEVLLSKLMTALWE
jgi:hypothetical protein